MNKKKYLIVTVITLCFLLTISGTVAYFNYISGGTIKVNTANYTINITSEAINNQAINLGNNLKPYDKGSFTINLNLTGTNTDVLTTVSIERINLPKGFKFLAQDDNISPFSTYSKTFGASTSTKTDSVTVYWYWDGDVDDESDSTFINQTLSANIVVKSKQMNGAMMKNGNGSVSSSRTEFWSDTYRPYIRTIKFDNDLSNLPSSCTGDSDLCWDVSYDSNQNKKVYAYLIDSGLDYTDRDSVSHDLYNLYIVSMAPIYAPSSCYYMFALFTNLTSIEFNNNFNTSNVTDMQYMFNRCSLLTGIDLSNFNTSKVTDMRSMFYNCSSLTSLVISSFNTSNVTNMPYMFENCSSLASLDISSFNTSNVTNMYGMFMDCSTLTSLDLNGFNTSNLTYMNYMFYNCSKLTNLDLSSFNTSKVTNMSCMFANCRSLASLDISSFNTSKVTNMNEMFKYCYKLTSLDLSNFNTSNVTDMGSMFYNCSSLISLDVSSFNTSKVTNMSYMFGGCSSLTNLNLSSFNTLKVTTMESMFRECSSLTTTINIMSTGVTNYTNMFYGAATKSGAQITVNYIADASTLVDNMIATKSSTSNVVKGSVIS